MTKPDAMNHFTAKRFTDDLKSYAAPAEYEKIRKYFAEDGKDNLIIGVRMKLVFDLAADYKAMDLAEVEKLLESPYYEARMGAVSILDYRARQKKISLEERKALFDLYIRRHDRINNWDFVDRAAPHVVGMYLLQQQNLDGSMKEPDILYQLARSQNLFERRTALVATLAFLRQKDIEHTLRLAEILVEDPAEYVQKAVGTFLREVGKIDEASLLEFLDQ